MTEVDRNIIKINCVNNKETGKGLLKDIKIIKDFNSTGSNTILDLKDFNNTITTTLGTF